MTYDFIIVGQGIAGTMVGLQLEQRHKSFMFLDPCLSCTSSQIAAGIVNPVTGRRFVKSWMYEELIQHATYIYRQVEEASGLPILREVDIIRTLMDHRTQNDWARKSVRSDFEPFISEEKDLKGYDNILKDSDYTVGVVKGGFKVEIANVIDHCRDKWMAEKRFQKETLDFSDLTISNDAIEYRGIRGRSIIFCEGYRFRDNPLFQISPLQPSKGELLIVQVKDHNLTSLFKRKYFYVPISKHHIWYGASNGWEVGDEKPTTLAFDKMKTALTYQLRVPFAIESHQAAIRPTVVDRRPFMGTHWTKPNVHVFNGLGTKGASLAPYWSGRFVDFILDRKPLHEDVDIRRFYK